MSLDLLAYDLIALRAARKKESTPENLSNFEKALVKFEHI